MGCLGGWIKDLPIHYYNSYGKLEEIGSYKFKGEWKEKQEEVGYYL